MKKIPSHYRQLLGHEVLRVGDYFTFNSHTFRMSHAYDDEIASEWPGYKFYRRRHVRLFGTPKPSKYVTSIVPEPRKTTTVQFMYPRKDCGLNSLRIVELISMDDTYLIGLERINNLNDWGIKGKSHKFKKFLRYKIVNGIIQLISYK